MREPETLAKRYEALSCLSLSLVSQTPENLPASLGALIRPLLDFDFMDLIVFKEGTSEVLWHSIGAGQFPTPDVPMEETTYWWVYQQKQPLYISDWKRDERFATRSEALKKLGLSIALSAACRCVLRLAQSEFSVLPAFTPTSIPKKKYDSYRGRQIKCRWLFPTHCTWRSHGAHNQNST